MRHPKDSEAGESTRTIESIGGTLAKLQPRMTSVALRFASDRDAAEDIVQNAFEKALKNHAQFRGKALFSTWVHRIVVNESLMWLRSEKRRATRHLAVEEWGETDWIEASPDPSQHLVTHERHERLRRCLESLPPEEREVLLRCGLQELSYEQFSSETGVRPAAAKSRAFRGRQRLRHMLAEA
jgi:RNA polymerase sigma-70 factor (ECF subfamily)